LIINMKAYSYIIWLGLACCGYPFPARSQTTTQPHWRQQVNYHIDVRLDDANHTLDGSMSMQYTNNSPDTLFYIWIQCWPNAFKNDRTAFSEQRLQDGKTDFYFSNPPQRGYINRLDFRVDGVEAKMEDHPQYIDIIKVILPKPLAPGGEITLTTPFHTQLPYNFSGNGWSADRYQVVQWYPKPAVYDSNGWHPLPYLGHNEAYGEHASFDVWLTLPKSFAVAATGQQDSAPAIAWSTPTPPHKPTGFFTPGQQPIKKRPLPPPLDHRRPPALGARPTVDTSTRTLHYYQQNTLDFTWFADRHFRNLHDTLNWQYNQDSTTMPRHRWIKPIVPALAYNEYDHLMIGVLIHNFTREPSPFKFFLAPLYATQTHQLNGLGQAFYTVKPGHGLQKIQFGLGLARFSTVSGTDSNSHQLTGGYYKITPSVLIVFPNGNAHNTFQASLEAKTYLIGEKALDNYVLKTTDSQYYPTAGKYSFRYLNQLSFQVKDSRVLYPYKANLQFQQASNFYRINFTGNYFFNYAKGGGLDIRVFGAKFGYLGGQSASEDLSPFEPKLTAVRGNEDYTYDNFFLGRNAFTGFPSQQIMDRDGDLHLRTDLFQGLQGRSDNWLTSLNARTTLPRAIVPEWLPLKLFLDVGTYAEAWQANPPTSRFLYTGGFELDLFHDVLRIYAPLVYSSDFSSQLRTVPDQNSFWKKITFSLDLKNIDWRKLFGYTPL
jgi:hypothetical protein